MDKKISDDSFSAVLEAGEDSDWMTLQARIVRAVVGWLKPADLYERPVQKMGVTSMVVQKQNES